MWPNYRTIEAGLASSDRYSWRYKDRQYAIRLDWQGRFWGEIDRQVKTSAWSIRDVLDKLFHLTK